MKIAITGASGFIGRTLGGELRAAGHDPVPVDLRASTVQAAAGAQAVVHLAAIARRAANARELRRVNVELAEQVGHAAAGTGMQMIFLSSVKVHGDEAETALCETSPIRPQDAYGDSKARAEEALRAIPGLHLAILRPPLVYGPGVKANFLALMNALARGMPLPLASIVNRRSLIYVGNLVDAVLHCLGATGTFLVSDGRSVSTAELCRALGEALGRPARLFPFPPVLLQFPALTRSLEIDDSAIRRQLGWQPPFSFEEGLRATALWYRNR